MYGLRFDHADIPCYIDVLSCLESAIAEAFLPGAFLVEFVPWLKYAPGWLPGAGWQQKVFKWRRLLDALVDGPYHAAREAMVRTQHHPLTSKSSSRLTCINKGTW